MRSLQELGTPCISDLPPFTINRAACMIFLALLQSSTGELSGLPAALRSGLGICTSPSARGLRAG